MTTAIYKSLLCFIVILTLSACSSQNGSEATFILEKEVRERALSILEQGIEDVDFSPSIHAAEGLTRAGFGIKVIQHLKPRLDLETDDARRAALARELIRAGERSSIAILTNILRKNDPASRISAAEGLFKVSEIGDRDAVIRAYNSKEDIVLHLMAAGALARSGNQQALDAIRTAYSTGNDEAIRIGAWLLGRLGTSDDILLLQSRIDDAPDEFVRSYIDHSLAALGSEDALNKLAANLSSPNPTIRAYAATFARDAWALSLSTKLIIMLNDPYNDVRYRAAQTLLAFGSNSRN